MKYILLFLILLTAFNTSAQTDSDPIRLVVNANQTIATVSPLFNGANIEDLNGQTNGGLLAQLLHGEAFEENIEPDFLHLNPEDYSKVYVYIDERRIPHLLSQANIYNRISWNNLSEKYDVHSKDVYAAVANSPRKENISEWEFCGRFLPYDSLPPNVRQTMLQRINGDEQVSKFWEKFISNNARSKFTLERNGDAYMGRQTQVISFLEGSGEVGLLNRGLYKQGIRFDAGKPYDGVLRIKADRRTSIFLSLRDENGAILDEKSCSISGSGDYEKIEFELTPNANAKKGSFGVSLKAVGEIRLGFAYLEPGLWGRIDGGYPIRRTFVEALKRQGIKAFRYNGSMVDVGADTYLYRWKKMIGPIDERRVTFRSGFNPYATHSFGFIEMLQAAEAVGATAIIGMSMDETYEDIRDFVEYVNGDVSTQWGAKRASHGHPAPYGLKYIQVDNERNISTGYINCMKKFAQAAWEKDPEMSIMTSLNIGHSGFQRDANEDQRAKILTLEKSIEQNESIIVAIEQGQKQTDSIDVVLGRPIKPNGDFEIALEQLHKSNDRFKIELDRLREPIGRDYRLASELAGWFITQGKADKFAWDPHYSGAREFADMGDAYLNEMGITLQSELAKDYPGFWLNLHPMEENGWRCDWDRGLAHAHNWNTNQRYGNSFVMLGTANTFQTHGKHYMWDQGRIHFTADTLWFQPSAHIDEMISRTWKNTVIQATSSDEKTLDITAKLSDDRREMTIYVANMTDNPRQALINIEGFNFKSRSEVQTIGDCDLNESNTYNNKENVVFKRSEAIIAKKNSRYTFPRYSFTVITLK